MDKVSEKILLEAIDIAVGHDKLDKVTEAPLYTKKVKENKLTDEDVDFLSIVIKICLRLGYKKIIEQTKKGEPTTKEDKYSLTAEKLEVELLNKAFDVLREKNKHQTNKRHEVMPVLAASPILATTNGDISGWLVVVLAFISITMLIYAIYITRKVKQRLKEKEER